MAGGAVSLPTGFRSASGGICKATAIRKTRCRIVLNMQTCVFREITQCRPIEVSE
jgi:hypothetical protein